MGHSTLNGSNGSNGLGLMGWVQLGASLYVEHSTLNGSLYIKWVQWVQWVQWVGSDGLGPTRCLTLLWSLYTILVHSTLNGFDGSNGLGPMGWVQLGASLYFDHSTLNGSLYIKWVQWVQWVGSNGLGPTRCLTLLRSLYIKWVTLH